MSESARRASLAGPVQCLDKILSRRPRRSLPLIFDAGTSVPFVAENKSLTEASVGSEMSSSEISNPPANPKPGAPVAPMIFDKPGNFEHTLRETQTISRPQTTASKSPFRQVACRVLDDDYDDDDIELLSVRKLPVSVRKPQRPVSVKLEPGARNVKAGQHRSLVPTSARASRQRGKRPSIIFNPQNAGSSEHSGPSAGFLQPSTSALPAQWTTAVPQSTESLQAEMDEIEALLHLLPEDLDDGGAPPAYSPPTKSIEQLIREQHAAFEDRIFKRMAHEFKTGAKRTRAPMSLEDALNNLRQASEDYAKAKAANDRRATKKPKTNGPGDEDDVSGGGKVRSKGGNGAGDKGGLTW